MIIYDRQFYGSQIEHFDSQNTQVIGVHAFQDCKRLKTVVLRKNIQLVGSGAFKNCSSLENVIIEESLMNVIPNECFRYCSNLKYIEFPQSISNISTNAFNACTSLESISFSNANTALNNSVFTECIKLSKINGGSNISSIENNTFSCCKSLTKLCLSNCQSIGANAFSHCELLQSISLDVDRYPNGCFSYCTSLRKLENAKAIKYIGELAFYECMALHSQINAAKDCEYEDLSLINTSINMHSILDSFFYVDGKSHKEKHAKHIAVNGKTFTLYV